MKDIVKTELPPCNFCQLPAKYDVPTTAGPWGYLCQPCYNIYSCAARRSAGYRFVLQSTPEMDRDRAINNALEMADFDLAMELVGDGDISEYL
jgi:hypothetical protein